MIIAKSEAELEVMAAAGAVVAAMHEVVSEAAVPGVSTARLDAIAEREIRNRGALPSFKGYRISHRVPPFPGTLCTSVNHQIVHGVPSEDVVLRAGDLLKVDAGAIVEGYHADSAVTWIIGDTATDAVRGLVAQTRAAMWEGLLAARVGASLTDIGAAVEVRGRRAGYGVISEYTGHGIGRALHEDPPVPNVGPAGRGPRLRNGIALAVEPMFTLGAAHSDVDEDGWTVVSADGSLSAHWEHTVAVTEHGPRILTARSDEPAWPDAEPGRVPGRRAPVAGSRRPR